ncbi:magnesium-translocating P-type ATPase [Microbacterium sp.]|uniref:magnesium-translocating P-type ATPase n=1 Tax=Microbacterium sp. TaxID=51671 RepID=UPI0009290BB1|nr:magnesium-translocating P-type ATPase [Microbacterium sp.]MBN9191606.1 magnesium-translocating P-type ATPase [Microbacterium sp.]OJU69399.1 MAG: magnesium-translocating P-type ATPase [Microbacterium sp. 70-38]
MDEHSPTRVLSSAPALPLRGAAAQDADEVLRSLGARPAGLSTAEAATRRAAGGPNVLRPHRARPWRVLGRQLRSPVLILLFVTAGVSVFLGEAANAVIIGVILAASIGLGFVNEFRAERAADALHDQLRHRVVVLRDGARDEIDVTDLVPGDIVEVDTGDVVPADLRLLETHSLSCDEGIVTGESLPVEKSVVPVAPDAGAGDLTSCALMGTVVQSGSATAVVVATGTRTEFGRIAQGLGTAQPQTEFQRGLGRFSVLLLEVALILTTLIFVANVLLRRPVLDSLLFSLAIAVGITPQLLPAVVSASLATGSRMLARRRVLVKRLVCIEDLGDMDVLVTDKTGTLTDGRISYAGALAADGTTAPDELLLLGLLATQTDYTTPPGSVPGLNPLDAALWEAPRPTDVRPGDYVRRDILPFDHERRRTTVLVEAHDGSRRVVMKGAAEDVMARCADIPAAASDALAAQYAAGSRVIAVAARAAADGETLTPMSESGFALVGFLVFVDRPKADARASLEKLARLGIAVKIATGDNGAVAEKVLSDLGVASGGTLIGADVDRLDDEELKDAVARVTVFARVSPEQKARIIRLLRHKGRSVGFLGDGVNDALALHQADIGISVDSAADVAKDAADVLLLDKDLGVLADGVTEGRRIFANTIKYLLMGTSSNFGNMVSASVASVVLPFLPMLPGQILLNNLLYDSGQLAIPGDRVDPEQLEAPSRWDIGFIRRFMLVFGPISSLFDFATFGLMLFVFHAAEGEFQAGWFIESIATQTLIIFAIRTRRVPFVRSRPSLGLTTASLAVVAIGVWLPYSPLSGLLGFRPLPAPFFLALVGMVLAYLVCVEVAKAWFFRALAPRIPHVHRPRTRGYSHRVLRRSSRFSARSPGAK